MIRFSIVRSRLRPLENTFLRTFVEAQTLEDGSAHLDAAALAFVGPVGELDLRYQFGLHVMNAAIAFHPAEERAAIRAKLLQALPHVGMRLLVEAAARLPDRNQALPFVIQA